MKPDDLIEGGVIRDSDLEGGPPQTSAELGPFGRYVLLEELGKGGAAIVYRALDPLLNRELALKKLRFGDRELEARFLREAELLARLSYPGIISIFDFGKEGDSHYYTMPLGSGWSLDRWIQERRPDGAESARVVRQVAEALAYAHGHGVLHRDVKPANILLSADGVPLLADFGLGRIEEPGRESGRVTESGEVMGTPSYMAPELATKDLKHADARCDVYSLGATLYEALTGAPPFVGTSALEILKRSTTEEPVPPRRRASATPVDLEIICLKALEKDPARRYATVREMADDLGRFLAGEPIHARRAGPLYRFRKFVGRRRAVVGVAGSAMGVIALILVVAAWRERSESARKLRVAGYLESADRHRANLDNLLRRKNDSDSEVVRQATLAFQGIDKALSESPGNAEALYRKGRIHALLIQEKEARLNYTLAIDKGPLAPAHLERSILECQELIRMMVNMISPTEQPRLMALKSRIRQDLERARDLGLDPLEREFAEALLEFSRLTAAGFKACSERLKGYVSRSPDWRAFYWKGISDIRLRRYEEARESLLRALDHRENCRAGALILNSLGIALSEMGFRDEDLVLQREARDRFRRATELELELADPPLHLASVLLYLEKPDEAIHWSGEALRRQPGMIKGHAVRGLAGVEKHKKNGDRTVLAQAKADLELALSKIPKPSPQADDLQVAWEYVVQHLPK